MINVTNIKNIKMTENLKTRVISELNISPAKFDDAYDYVEEEFGEVMDLWDFKRFKEEIKNAIGLSDFIDLE